MNKDKNLQSSVLNAIHAWEKGEATGNYEAFVMLIASESEFNLFSQPMKGKFSGNEARKQILSLIKKREINKNNLLFFNIEIFEKEKAAIVQFDSKGTINNGQTNYEGYNAIAFYFNKSNQITGFREYFGYVDAAWFKNSK